MELYRGLLVFYFSLRISFGAPIEELQLRVPSATTRLQVSITGACIGYKISCLQVPEVIMDCKAAIYVCYMWVRGL